MTGRVEQRGSGQGPDSSFAEQPVTAEGLLHPDGNFLRGLIAAGREPIGFKHSVVGGPQEGAPEHLLRRKIVVTVLIPPVRPEPGDQRVGSWSNGFSLVSRTGEQRGFFGMVDMPRPEATWLQGQIRTIKATKPIITAGK